MVHGTRSRGESIVSMSAFGGSRNSVSSRRASLSRCSRASRASVSETVMKDEKEYPFVCYICEDIMMYDMLNTSSVSGDEGNNQSSCAACFMTEKDLERHIKSCHRCRFCGEDDMIDDYHGLQVHLLTSCPNSSQLFSRTRGYSSLASPGDDAYIRKRFRPESSNMEPAKLVEKHLSYGDMSHIAKHLTSHQKDNADSWGSGGSSSSQGNSNFGYSSSSTLEAGERNVPSPHYSTRSGEDGSSVDGPEPFQFGAPPPVFGGGYESDCSMESNSSYIFCYYDRVIASSDNIGHVDNDNIIEAVGATMVSCCESVRTLLSQKSNAETFDYLNEDLCAEISARGLEIDAHECSTHFGQVYMKPEFYNSMNVVYSNIVKEGVDGLMGPLEKLQSYSTKDSKCTVPLCAILYQSGTQGGAVMIHFDPSGCSMVYDPCSPREEVRGLSSFFCFTEEKPRRLHEHLKQRFPSIIEASENRSFLDVQELVHIEYVVLCSKHFEAPNLTPSIKKDGRRGSNLKVHFEASGLTPQEQVRRKSDLRQRARTASSGLSLQALRKYSSSIDSLSLNDTNSQARTSALSTLSTAAREGELLSQIRTLKSELAEAREESKLYADDAQKLRVENKYLKQEIEILKQRLGE